MLEYPQGTCGLQGEIHMTKKNTMLLRLMLFMALAMIAFSLVACDKPSVMPEPQESSTTKETSIVPTSPTPVAFLKETTTPTRTVEGSLSTTTEGHSEPNPPSQTEEPGQSETKTVTATTTVASTRTKSTTTKAQTTKQSETTTVKTKTSTTTQQAPTTTKKAERPITHQNMVDMINEERARIGNKVKVSYGDATHQKIATIRANELDRLLSHMRPMPCPGCDYCKGEKECIENESAWIYNTYGEKYQAGSLVSGYHPYGWTVEGFLAHVKTSPGHYDQMFRATWTRFAYDISQGGLGFYVSYGRY